MKIVPVLIGDSHRPHLLIKDLFEFEDDNPPKLLTISQARSLAKRLFSASDRAEGMKSRKKKLR